MSKATLWCGNSAPQLGEGIFILWDQYRAVEDSMKVRSIPYEVREQADKWEKEYGSWLHRIRKSTLRNRSLEDDLSLSPNFSFWWCSFPSEMPFSEDSTAKRVIYSLALEEILVEHGIDCLEVFDAPRFLRKALKRLSARPAFTLRFRSAGNFPTLQAKMRKLRSAARESVLRHFLSSINVFLSQLLRAISRRSLARRSAARLKGDVVVIDYLIGYRNWSLSSASRRPIYWGPLPEIFGRENVHTDWIHLDHRVLLSKSRESSIFDQALGRELSGARHLVIQDFVAWRAIGSSLVTHLAVMATALRWQVFRKSWLPDKGLVAEWPLISRGWFQFFYGGDSAMNSILYHAFKILSARAKASKAIFMMENQAWEKTFLANWLSAPKREAFGVVHSPIRAYDFRYTAEKESHFGWSVLCPRPNIVITNGRLGTLGMLNSGWDSKLILELEALRFSKSLPSANSIAPRRVSKCLILGDYDLQITLEMLSYARTFSKEFPGLWTFAFRPHPSTKTSSLGGVRSASADGSSSLLRDLSVADLVVCPETSASQFDAAIAGIPRLLVASPRILPSATRDGPAREIAFSYEEFSVSLLQIFRGRSAADSIDSSRGFFRIDSRFELWNYFVQSKLRDEI